MSKFVTITDDSNIVAIRIDQIDVIYADYDPMNPGFWVITTSIGEERRYFFTKHSTSAAEMAVSYWASVINGMQETA